MKERSDVVMTRYIEISIRYRYIESNRQKKYRIFRYIAIFQKYRDISEISRYFLIYRDIFRRTLIVFQGKLRNSRRTVCHNLMTVFN